MATLTQAWTPNSSVRTHQGDSVSKDALFFCVPDKSIGKVLSAESTVKISKPPFNARTIQLLKLVWMGICLGFVGWCIISLEAGGAGKGNWFGAFLASSLIGMLPLLVGLVIIRIAVAGPRVCTFVGENGLAMYWYPAPVCTVYSSKIVLFEECEDLLAGVTHSYINNVIYAVSSYKYQWRDKSGAEKFVLGGEFRSKDNNPSAGDPYWFADAAEDRWNKFAFKRAAEKFQRDGYLEFEVGNSERVRISPSQIRISQAKNESVISPDDIKCIGVHNGEFFITTHEARWFNFKGRYGFLYKDIANGKLFLIAVEKLGGFTLTE